MAAAGYAGPLINSLSPVSHAEVAESTYRSLLLIGDWLAAIVQLSQLAAQSLYAPSHVPARRLEIRSDPTFCSPSGDAPGADSQDLRGF